MDMVMVWLIIQGVIFGVVTNLIIKNKGYKENWFWWGFFFSFFAVIVAATKPENRATNEGSSNPGISPVTPKPLVTEDLNVNDMLNKVDIKSPVQIASWKIQQENDDFMLLIDFMNVSENIVTAVMFTVVGYNSFSDKVLVDGKDEFEVLGQDYSIHQGMKGTVKHKLPSADIRKVNLQIKKVCFSDSMIYNHKESEFVTTKLHSIDKKYIDCLTKANRRGKYYAIMMPEYWQCVCGFVNTGNSCVMCHMAKDQAAKYTEESIETIYQAFAKEQAEQRKKAEEIELKNQEYEKAQAELKAKKIKKTKRLIICSTVLVCLGVGIYTITINAIIPSMKYDKATQYISERRYSDAIAILQSLDSNYKDTEALLKESTNWSNIELAKDFLNKEDADNADIALKNIVDPNEEQITEINNLTESYYIVKAKDFFSKTDLDNFRKCLEHIDNKPDELIDMENRLDDFYQKNRFWLGSWMCCYVDVPYLEFVPHVNSKNEVVLALSKGTLKFHNDETALCVIEGRVYNINKVDENTVHCLATDSDGANPLDTNFIHMTRSDETTISNMSDKREQYLKYF